MKKITKKEFNKFKVLKNFKPKVGIFKVLDELGVDEGLIIELSLYEGSKVFSSKVHQVFRKKDGGKHFKVKTLRDKAGWAVLRLR